MEGFSLPEEVLELLFPLLPPRLAGTLAAVASSWSLPIARSDHLWRSWALARWAWWPDGALDERPDEPPGAVRRAFQLRVKQERRTDELLLGVGGQKTEAVQRELLVGGPYMDCYVYERAQATASLDLSQHYFAKRMARRLVVNEANQKLASLLQAAAAAEGDRMQRRLAEAGAHRPPEAWLERGALLIERYAKHGHAALRRASPIDEAAAERDANYVATRIAALAEAVRARLPDSGPGSGRRLAIVRAACHVLFEEEGICGDEDAYYNPENSFLSDVLRRKKGIPISLCTLLAAVCARLGVTLGAVSFPMTFHLVLPASHEVGPEHPLYIDAFGGGVVKSSDEMVAWLRGHNFTGAVQPQWFEPCASGEVWARMLRNLVGIAQQQGNHSNAGAGAALQLRLLTTMLATASTASAHQDQTAQMLISSLRLAASCGELPEWVDHANIVIEASQATAAPCESTADGLLGMVKAQIEAVQMNIRGGHHSQDGGEMQSIDSEFVRTYGGSNEAIAARAAHTAKHVLHQEAAGRSCAESSCWKVQVGTIIRHNCYGYRGVIYGYDPCCMASESWQQQMNVNRLESGADQPFYHVLVDNRDRPGDESTYVAEENVRVLPCVEADEEALATGLPVCEDFVFWRRVSNVDPVDPIGGQYEPEPQQSSQSQLPTGSPGGADGFSVIWGDRHDKGWISGSKGAETVKMRLGSGSGLVGSSTSSACTAGPIIHAELGKYFARLVAVDGAGCRIPATAMQPCASIGTGFDDPRWQQPHTFAYEPNVLLRHFYPVPPPTLAGTGERENEQDLRYTTDDATSTQKRKERGLSTD